MLGGGAFVILGLLAAHAAGQLITTDAKCLLGYEWVCFSRITDQSIYLTTFTDFQYFKSESLRCRCFTGGSVRTKRT